MSKTDGDGGDGIATAEAKRFVCVAADDEM